MMDNKNILTLSYIVISAIAIVFLIALLVKCKKESFCACRHMTSKRCPNPHVLTDLYNSGKLTEFTDFAKIQQANPKWKQIMPDDIFNEQMQDYYKKQAKDCKECKSCNNV
jgi:hypothetical protein